jgi:hypothetical protein
MTTQANLMGLGASAPLAAAIIGASSPATALTATGNSQGTALLLTTDFNVVTTTAASTGVILPAIANFGDEVFIANLGANTLAVFPSTGGKINNGTANASISVSTLKATTLRSIGSPNWVAITGA